MKSTPRRKSSRRAGTAAVEFAMVLPVFVLVIVGAMELCNLNTHKALVINETREATRLAINSNADASQIISSTVSQIAQLLDTPTSTVSCSCTAIAPNGTERALFSQAVRGDIVEVTVSVPYSRVAIFAASFTSDSFQISDTCIMQKE